MIGFILGTSEGKEILSLMNNHTEDIVISTATKYGAELLKDYKYKYVNSKPLDKEEFIKLVSKYNINVLIDVSHPYAEVVSKTAIEVCKDMNIDYVRYERKSFFQDIKESENIIKIDSYKELENVLSNVEGNVLNTTGSNNVKTITALNLNNRIIHRVLPSMSVLQKLLELEVPIENIIAIKGPFGYALNDGLIKEYKIRVLITKDSGFEGGTNEKIQAALDNNVKIIVLEKPKISYGEVFQDIKELVECIREKYI